MKALKKLKKTYCCGYAENRQFKNYKTVLGEDIPTTLEEFQKMKYNDSEKYRLAAGYYQSVRNGDISPLVGFELYKNS